MQEYNKTNLISHLDELYSILFGSGYKNVFSLIQENEAEFEELIHQAVIHCGKLGGSFLCNHNEDPTELNNSWREVLSREVDSEIEIKSEVGTLFKRTKKFLRSLLSIPYKKEAIRRYSTRTLAEVMERTADEKAKISAQLVKEKKKVSPDEDTIQNLEKLREVSDKELEELYKERTLQELEEASEKDWSEKIKESFLKLRECTMDIEKEYEKADTEYRLFLYGLILPSIILLIWLCNLYGFIINCQFPLTNWIQFLPYYIPVPILIAVFWLLIVQKNRAGKICVVLSDRLYQIKYLEGLLMTINRLSPNSQDAIEAISRCLETMVNGYLNGIANNPMDELHLEKIEKRNFEEDPYLKIIDKLTDIIKK